MNYRERIRKAIECPQLNNTTRYGEWGILTLEQRRYIKRLLDELDSADNCVKKLYLENQKQKKKIDKAIDLLNNPWSFESGNKEVDDITYNKKRKVIDILKGNQNE